MRWLVLLALASCWTDSQPAEHSTAGPLAAPARSPRPRTPAPSAEDSDGDGIPNDRDKCPNDPEDRDGFQDADGCPDPDNDGDGVADVDDRCPNEPGPAAKGGCP
jgi:hypothetical protein